MKTPKAKTMHPILEEQAKLCEEKFANMLSLVEGQTGESERENLKSFLRLSNLACMNAVLKMLEEKIEGKGKMYCTSGCGCSYPSGDGSHERSCVWEYDKYNPYNEAISDISTTLTEIKKQLE